jgi:diaminohydroxyphosphoribosylaminopyrimidine deaminase / 5-amino-6-(5-phosphoribosylamino)uracil reductase
MPHTQYMLRCLELAEKAMGATATNPLVGSVVVHNEGIIGEGFHRKFGAHHAEVEAIASVTNPTLLNQSTLYVNLEPCSHFGKTPPCANLILQHQIPRVVYGMVDPNPKVAGKGLQLLKDAGVEVIGPILEERCAWVNRRFVHHITTQRPWILLKWAQSKDGYMDIERAIGQSGSFPISGPLSQSIVHQWRTQEMGILVGVQTALNDLPKLNVRYASGNQPLRIVLDPHGRLKNDHPMCHDGLPLIRVCIGDPTKNNASFLFVEPAFQLTEILHQLYLRGLASVLVEGGRRTLDAFLDQNLWNEARIFTSPDFIGAGLVAPKISSTPAEVIPIGRDILTTFLA